MTSAWLPAMPARSSSSCSDILLHVRVLLEPEQHSLVGVQWFQLVGLLCNTGCTGINNSLQDIWVYWLLIDWLASWLFWSPCLTVGSECFRTSSSRTMSHRQVSGGVWTSRTTFLRSSRRELHPSQTDSIASMCEPDVSGNISSDKLHLKNSEGLAFLWMELD